jgi:hypothetical protein
MVSGGMIYIQILMISWSIRVISGVLPQQFEKLLVLVLLMRGIYHVCHWHGCRWCDIYVPSFKKVGVSLHAILRVCLRNLRCCDDGITDGRDVLCTPLRCLHVVWYIQRVFFNFVDWFMALRFTATDALLADELPCLLANNVWNEGK